MFLPSILILIETFRFAYEYEIEYEYDFLKLVCVAWITACHTNLVSRVSLSAGKQREGGWDGMGMGLI